MKLTTLRKCRKCMHRRHQHPFRGGEKTSYLDTTGHSLVRRSRFQNDPRPCAVPGCPCENLDNLVFELRRAGR